MKGHIRDAALLSSKYPIRRQESVSVNGTALKPGVSAKHKLSAQT
jgi:hypothetical protein